MHHHVASLPCPGPVQPSSCHLPPRPLAQPLIFGLDRNPDPDPDPDPDHGPPGRVGRAPSPYPGFRPCWLSLLSSPHPRSTPLLYTRHLLPLRLQPRRVRFALHFILCFLRFRMLRRAPTALLPLAATRPAPLKPLWAVICSNIRSWCSTNSTRTRCPPSHVPRRSSVGVRVKRHARVLPQIR